MTKVQLKNILRKIQVFSNQDINCNYFLNNISFRKENQTKCLC